MTPDEQNLIENLFERLRQADGTPKDPQAEQLIRAKTTALPSAPYLLAQAVIVQEHALTNAQARIADLENRLAAGSQNAPAGGGGSFLSGVSRLFGGNKPATPPPVPQQPQYQQQQPQYQQVPGTGAPATPPPVPMAAPQAMPYPSTVNLAPSSGGGFLKSALATAAGVAGGAALFQGIESLIGHNAGAFGPALGERGLAGGETENTEIVNNYYNDSPGSGEAGKERADYQPDVAQNDFDQNQNIDFDPNLTADNDPGQSDDFGGSDDFGSGSDDSLV
ncbi:MAG: DUF2076 domain-containing protein [Verrucomicrobia bacterium]|nr:DUF2076 domain-containing protein [Verrucomicrobiota bacterium]MBV8483930.1 DUF2076 domain-containing protein [Verrucomicrobiota bacterium]